METHLAGRGRVLSHWRGDRAASEEDNLRVEEGEITDLALVLFPGEKPTWCTWGQLQSSHRYHVQVCGCGQPAGICFRCFTGSESSAHLTLGNSSGSADILASASEWPKHQGALRTICLAFFLLRVLTALGEERRRVGCFSTLSHSMSLYRKINRETIGR